ncbi:(2Fe-2S)-binding protein [Alicyclobacillus cycloheptanicus]|jgi:ferredoxin|uniref:Ferredoxin n=1 Tax=Alicyclobacillus cycloheptanicus TaxID=1457 RepID=A0ABT9XI41_9BACL|nr:2Fe-2S iron-sulfur cluster-binding protein [Alicyclobacillus cycloheptanicus]MDQ0189958.1 ferredoxin [Alicyclobacillus cycloheptanicus]WDM02146.1 (2Fe-2S)-binding protein [Alicyclobacillus cycloheptanicus]
MVKIILHGVDGLSEHEVPEGSNLVVLAGVKKLPGLRYSCGMGRCTRCASRVIGGAEHLPPPNWKEERMLGEDKLAEGYRLLCQLTISHDLEIVQDRLPLKPAWKRLEQKV